MTAHSPISSPLRARSGLVFLPLALLAGLLLAACDTAPPPGPTFATRDSAGVTLAENFGEPPVGENGWRIGSEPVLQIGTLEGEDAYMFQRIWGATRLSNGVIAVVDNLASELRIYSPTGEHLNTFGRKGEGPAEFDSPVLMGALPGDTLVVVDRLLRRVNLYHPDQGFIRGATATPEIQGYLLTVGMFGSGAVMIWDSQWTQEMPNGFFRFPIRYLSVELDGSIGHDFGEHLGDETVYSSRAEGEGTMVLSTTLPFGKGPSAAVAGDRFFYSSQDRYEIQVTDEAGRLLRIIRRDLAPRPVTEDHRAELIEGMEDQADDNDQMREFRRMMRDAPIPDFHPALGTIYADALGYLWVEETRMPDEEVRHTTLFDPEGRMVGQVVLPARVQVQEIGADYLLGRWTDDLGVNYLRMYELERPTD